MDRRLGPVREDTVTTKLPSSDDVIVEIDLTDPEFLDALLEERHTRRFDEPHLIDWLRSSGGSLTDRLMKNLAADALERYRTQD
jgi:hypothetical protein